MLSLPHCSLADIGNLDYNNNGDGVIVIIISIVIIGRFSSFVTQWQKALEIHGGIGSSRYDMGEALNHMANDFTSFCEEKERVLKQIREINSQNLREVEDAVIAMERTKQKYEAQCRDWERLLLKKNGRIDLANQLSKSRHIGGTVSGIFHKHKNLTPEMLEQLEKEARVKVKICNENYKLQLTNTNRIRSSYYGEELPNSIQKMYDLVLEIDEELKTRLRRYVYMYESCMLSDALLIKPTDQPGMSDLVEYIDNQGDLDAFVRAMSKSQESPTRTNIPYLEYEMSPVARSFANPKPIFGVPLEKQVARDNKRIPVILTKCINVIEVCGLQQEGLYRLSGQLSVINKLQADFDIDADKVDLQASVYKDDVNNLTGLVKQYLRKLPDGLISSTQCIKLAHIINSAGGKADNAISAFKTELESMAEHNYHVLAYLIHHFEKVQAFQEYNMMNSANLSIVLGPTIVGADGLSNPADQFKTQSMVIKFMIDNARDLFPSEERQGTETSAS
ncbi:Rho GTPase-activating protein [Spiromyces aspiralis]|uniref:Rho GTPase-activating protein n=1 Tax=Spiromyces aspiralis TaxID=68401 RepID=A0ACC1HD57_9FUNG|nr:Rho GTPase-activating protein [Spiromyces aspiralis]